MNDIIDLGGLPWTVRPHGALPADAPDAADAEFSAIVPGCVHDDLLAAGVIPDPYSGVVEKELGWVAETDWSYRTVFDLAPLAEGDGWRLEFDGLQTVAQIEVNGQALARTENMHRRYAFDVSPLLHSGQNEVRVLFPSAVAEMRARADADGIDYPYDWAHPYNRLRTMASSVGWDWGPTLVSAGIWRAARLRRIGERSLEVDLSTRLSADLQDGTLVVDTTLTTRDGSAEQDVEVTLGDHRWVRTVPIGRTRLELPVPRPELWWPAGHGDPVLQEVTVGFAGEDPTPRGRVGFRHVAVRAEADVFGRSFALQVNGKALFVRGVNWIPDDVFPSRMTRDRYAARIAEATAANVSLLRVWGGGIYEGADFYRLCDEQGILVWQDFLFACAAYPESEEMLAEVGAEATDVVSRLGGHPSIVVWNGSNENLLAWHDWGWPDRLGTHAWGERLYREILPGALAEHLPDAIYVPSSPFSLTPEVHPNTPGDGTVHLWDPWNRLDYAHYRDSVPRFAAEFGFQAPANWSTLAAALGPDEMHPDSPTMIARQKQPNGMAKLRDRLHPRFPDPERIAADGPSWHFATQLNQAEAIRVAIEHFRSWWPRTAGSIVWQFNDTWPALSWSVLDAAGGRKLGWYALRRAYADRLVTVQPREAGLSLLLVNDTDEDWIDEAVARRVALTGQVHAEERIPFRVEARSVSAIVLPTTLTLPFEQRDEIIVVDAGAPRADGSRRAVHTFMLDDGVRWESPRFESAVTSRPQSGGVLTEVTITARSALCGLSVQADRLDPSAVVDSALVTLLPGESHTFRIRSAGPLEPESLVNWPVLATRNEFHR